MKDEDKTKEQLLDELAALRKWIAELKSSGAEPEPAQEMPRALMEDLPQGVVIIQDSRIVFTNTAFSEISGYSLDELMSLSAENIKAMIHPDDQQYFWERLQEHLQGKPTSPNHEYRGIRKDGSECWLEMFAKHIEYGGKPAVLGAVVDISQRRRARGIQRALYRIANAAHTTEDLKDLLRTIHQDLSAVVNTQNFYIALYDRESETFSLPYYTDEREQLETFPAGKTLTAYVLKNEKALLATSEEIERLIRSGEVEAIGTLAKVWLGIPIKIGEEIGAVLVVQSYSDERAYDEKDLEILEFVSGQIGLSIQHKQAQEEIKQSFQRSLKILQATVDALASSVEMRDPYTVGHQRRVTQLACAIAEELGLAGEETEGLHMAGLVHDIGKVTVPADILVKPGQLTLKEFDMIKTHPQVGYDILKTIEFPWPVAEMVLQHHERMDGSGYPNGLVGEETLLAARILAVADVVEGMVSHRSYRQAPGLKKALDEISQHKGARYDPQVVDVCLKLFREKRFKFEEKAEE